MVFKLSHSKFIGKILNKSFQNNHLRVFLLLLIAVLTGYTLQPVPKFLNKLFDNCNFFKYIILLLMLTFSFYPVDSQEVFYILVLPLLLLLFFDIVRKNDDFLEKKVDQYLEMRRGLIKYFGF